jgi:hypothetical protein
MIPKYIAISLALFIAVGLTALFLTGGASVEGAVSPAVAEKTPNWAHAMLTQTYPYSLSLPLVFLNYEPPLPTVFGAQVYRGMSETSTALSLAGEAHIYWIRWSLSWSQVEPENVAPEAYHWDAADVSIRNATEAGLHLIVTIWGNPEWAATYHQGPIDKVDLDEFVSFVAAAVERYDGDGIEDAPGSPVVDYWELYNEPDGANRWAAEQGYGSYWGNYAVEYTQMLCAVYPVIKAANPRAKVALGGLAYDSFKDEGGSFVREFLDQVLDNGCGSCFDLMNFHYYPAFEGRWNQYGHGLSGKATFLRDKLAAHGITDKPMISTEAGWHSNDYPGWPSTPEIQSRYVVKLFVQSLASDLDIMIWWMWIDPAPPYGENGLLTQSLDKKLSYDVYQVAAEKLGRTTFVEEWPAGEGVEGYHFVTRTGQSLYVLWADDDSVHAVQLPLSEAQVIDMTGNLVYTVTSGGGTITVDVGADPLYVEAVP